MAEIDRDKLCTAFDQITDRIISVTASDKPDYNIDGQIVKRGKYLSDLTDAQAALAKQIAMFQDLFEIPNEVIT